MKRIASSLFVGLLCGCAASQLSPEQMAEIKSVQESNRVLVEGHKITNVEAAGRLNLALARALGDRVTDRDRQMMDYRLALGSQVDKGQITPETRRYLWNQRVAELQAQDQAEQIAAMQQVGASMQQTGSELQAQSAQRFTYSLPPPPAPPPPMPVDTSWGDHLMPRQQSAIGIPQGAGLGAYVGTVPGGPNVYVIPPGAGP